MPSAQDSLIIQHLWTSANEDLRGTAVSLTGLPAAGKTSLGHALTSLAGARGIAAHHLDGDQRRDPKGLYARARRGELQHLTDVDDPYELPLDPEIVIRPADGDPHACAKLILAAGARASR